MWPLSYILFIVVLPSWLIQEVIPDWQQAASNILVAVGNKHINDIMEEILSKFQPGVLPHFFVVQTLANLSDSNGKDIFTGVHERKNVQSVFKEAHMQARLGFWLRRKELSGCWEKLNLLNLSSKSTCRSKILHNTRIFFLSLCFLGALCDYKWLGLIFFH